jgi:phosphoribosylformylglycinamidine synthase
VRLPSGSDAVPVAARLFGEEPSRIVLSLAKEDVGRARALAEQHGVPFEVIGEVGGNTVAVEGACEVEVSRLMDAHHRCLEPIVGV